MTWFIALSWVTELVVGLSYGDDIAIAGT